MTEQTISSRNGTRQYIDEQAPPIVSDIAWTSDKAASVDSGSSVEEEVDDDDKFSIEGSSDRDDPVDAISSRLEEFSYLDRRHLDDGFEESSGEGDWEVDDEDWELANGDFTKQYNRLRQQHSVQNPIAGPSTSRLDQRPASQAPLPARNRNDNTRPQGVALNPKAVLRSTKDKSDRATQEQVLDPRTRLVLSGLVNRGIIGRLERCVSTGKEANVYHALVSNHAPPSVGANTALAVKIYRTSILSFRARQAYIVGEHRFKGEYSSSRNARKMVRVWAEKELRNLRRLEQFGVRAPRVVEGKENVLVMEYLGTGDTASPRLKDAQMPDSELQGLYTELLVAMRRMYRQCRLVHGDLSEYNILYHDAHLYIIDVSQSVEHDHPKTFDFLRTDIRNVEEYFKRRSGGEIRTLGHRRSWEFIVSESVGLDPTDELGDQGEHRLAAVLSSRLEEEVDETDDAVFMSSFIPRTLGEVYDPERDAELVIEGRGDELIYSTLAGLERGNERPTKQDEVRQPGEEDEEGETEEDIGENVQSRPRGFRNEDKEEKKERKKAVKEAKRDQRQKKMPKSEKKRLIKKSAG